MSPRAPRPSPGHRWRQWQASLVSQQYLTPHGARHGYTLLHVPASQREVFFDAATLLQVLRQFEGQAVSDEAHDAVQAWRVWTRRLTAYLQRLASGRAGTMPTLPREVHELLDAVQEVAP